VPSTKAKGAAAEAARDPLVVDLASRLISSRSKSPDQENQAAALPSSPAFCILAVDPGLTGALAFYFPAQDAISAEDMPVVGGDVDAATLDACIAQMRPDVAIVEIAASRPGQGVASVFKFGCGYGKVLGVIAANGIPLHLVSPSKWKRHFGLDADKEKPRALALRLWPASSDLFGRRKDHGRAESALLARYAAECILTNGGAK